MAIARLYNFAAGTPAVADQVDAELNQLVTGVNETVPLAGGAMTGALLLSGAPAVAAGAATKAYVDAAAGAGGESVVRKIVDESIASSTVLQNDDHLFFAAEMNAIYRVELDVVYLTTNTAFKWGFLAPAGTTYNGVADFTNVSLTALGSINAMSQVGFNQATALPTAPNTMADPAYKWLQLSLLVSIGATAGSFNFQWAQAGSNVSPATVKANSNLRYRKIS